ncbi:MAG: acetyl-CoA C-acyltransferase [Actinobacteria bacterium]|nr:acetyl-CoA C-acyltransferase [Actinomycetota bacterium]
MQVRSAFLVAGVRTPIGRYGGALASVRPDDLLALAFRALVERTGLDPANVDEVVAGCANQAGEDNRDVARMSALLAGFPIEVPGITVNRLCASGLAAIVHAYRAIAVGEGDLFVAGGVESMSRAPYVMAKPDAPFKSGAPEVVDSALGWRFVNPAMAAMHPPIAMGETAENLVERYGVGRDEQDEFALRSHRAALAAWDRGFYEPDVVPVEIAQRKGDPIVVERDEGPRPDTSLEKLARLRPAFREGGTVTAGNASSLNDGAGAVLVASEDALARHGLTPVARIVATGQAGVDPSCMGIGPVPATHIALERAGWKVDDVDTVELNEAFAGQCLAVLRELPFDLEQVNPDGGAIALGHPLGMSGTRLVLTLMRRMQQDPGMRRGLATLCVGVGQGESMLVESVL